MDPDVAMGRFLQALYDKDREAATEAYDDMIDWLNGGGYMPVMNPRELKSVMRRALKSIGQKKD